MLQNCTITQEFMVLNRFVAADWSTGRPSSGRLFCNKFVGSDTAQTTAACDVEVIYLRVTYIGCESLYLSLSLSVCLPGTYQRGRAQISVTGIAGLHRPTHSRRQPPTMR